MELPYVTNAPRELSLGGVTYRARTLTIGALGEVLAWLEDRIPPDPERTGPVLLSSEPAQLALESNDGLALVLHLACLDCHPAMTRDDARALAAAMTPEETARLRAIAYRRRPEYGTPIPSDYLQDLAQLRWGEVFDALSGHDAGLYARVAGITLDQYDCHCAKGEVAYPDDVSVDSLQALWEAEMAKGGELPAPAAPDPAPAPAPGLPPERPVPRVDELPPERPLPEVIP